MRVINEPPKELSTSEDINCVPQELIMLIISSKTIFSRHQSFHIEK